MSIDIKKAVSWIALASMAFSLIIGTGVRTTAATGPAVEYSWVKNMSTATDSLNTVINSKGIYVAAGKDGTIKTSVDGSSWKTQKSKTISCLNGIACNGKLFAVVGNSGTIITSPDGVSWTPRSSGLTNNLNAVAWGKSGFIAVGDQGVILKSKDGVSWSKVSANKGKNLLTIIWNGKKYAAAGQLGTIFLSNDGIAWSGKSVGTQADFCDMVWNGKIFVAVGYGKGQSYYGSCVTMARSSNGQKWELKEFQIKDSKSVAKGVCWNGKSFIAIGGTLVYISQDGFSWNILLHELSDPCADIIWNGKKCIAVGDYGKVFTSSNGTAWQTVNPNGIIGSVKSIAGNGSSYVAAIDHYRNGYVYTSKDGDTWTESPKGSEKAFYNRVIWNKDQYFIAGDRGKIISSKDGYSWSVYSAMASYDFQDIIGKYGLTIAAVGSVGVEDHIIVSSDGLSWTKVVKEGKGFSRIGCNGRLLVAVGDSGYILTSGDGKAWTMCKSGTTSDLKDIAYSGSRLVTVGKGGAILTSTDGMGWKKVKSGTTQDLNCIIWTGSKFLAAGNGGSLLSSKDGTTWTQVYSGTTNDIYTVWWDGNKVIMGGANGLIMKGTPK